MFPMVVAPFDGTSRAAADRRREHLVPPAGIGRRPASITVAAPPRVGRARPYVLTIHDLQYRTYPEYFSRTKRRTWRR